MTLLAVAGVGLLIGQLAVLGSLPRGEWLARWWPALAVVPVLAAAVLLIRKRTGAGGERQPHDWARTTGLVTALTAVGALVFTGLSLQASRQQIGISEQTLLTDRFLRAVEQLASQGVDKVHLRIGGIYALERVAVDSPRDRTAVEELLAAFLRDRSPRPTDRACPETPADAHAAFRVLVRRPPNDSQIMIDLRRTCLTKVNAPEADLSRMSLFEADLTEANLYQAHTGLTAFGNAILVGARLSSAKFGSYTFVDGADLTNADLTYADLTRVHLTNVKLSGADLTDAKHGPATDISTAIKDATTKGAWW
ncbi:pentapeptide repeat-containing protein [Lentzea waywayandensis]|uniref:pentapeptide repeat-containing protein n=1 Tax=Lentzea waywayandensis TaxID=84724 RepID=UPI0015A703EB|nr:pentapeptide repeat-containing protein [Lentzea waywayandensis]